MKWKPVCQWIGIIFKEDFTNETYKILVLFITRRTIIKWKVKK